MTTRSASRFRTKSHRTYGKKTNKMKNLTIFVFLGLIAVTWFMVLQEIIDKQKVDEFIIQVQQFHIPPEVIKAWQDFIHWAGPQLQELGKWLGKEFQEFVKWIGPQLQELGKWIQNKA